MILKILSPGMLFVILSMISCVDFNDSGNDLKMIFPVESSGNASWLLCQDYFSSSSYFLSSSSFSSSSYYTRWHTAETDGWIDERKIDTNLTTFRPQPSIFLLNCVELLCLLCYVQICNMQNVYWEYLIFQISIPAQRND